MPLILTWQYFISVILAFLITFVAKNAGLRRTLWLIAAGVIFGTLWALGIQPLGFLVSVGGWIMLLLTILIAKQIANLV